MAGGSKDEINSLDTLKSMDGVPLKISVLLGTAQISLGELAKLGRGSILELDTRIGEPLGIYANGKLIARGEVVIKENNQAGIQISSISSSEKEKS